MSEKNEHNKQAKSRRQLLKATIAGTGAVVAGKSLPEQWSRPLVESVTLPAHAQTSVANVGGAVMGSLNQADASDYLLDLLLPAAMAGGVPGFPRPEPSVIEGLACVQENGDDTVNVQALFQYASWEINYPYFTGSNIPVNTTTPLVLQNATCSSTFVCTVNVAIAGGAATGSFSIEETETTNTDTMGQVDFDLPEPGCPIEMPVPDCRLDGD